MKKINQYIDGVFCKEDEQLEAVIASIQESGMPEYSVSPSSGKFLTMLVSITGAKKVLEIGALGGYSGICLARGFGQDGLLTSLELKEDYAKLAKENLKKAGFGEQVSYLTGEALVNLKQLARDGERFDLFFIDADKGNYENYLNACLKLSEPNAVIVIDNVLAGGSVANTGAKEKRYTSLMIDFNEWVANHPQLESVLLPVGDGMTVVRCLTTE